MRVLIFGGTRCVGVHLAEALLDRGHTVTIATRGIRPNPFEKAVTHIVTDRGNPKRLKQDFNAASYDVVCDSLAYCSGDVRMLLSAIPCKRYVQISSASVYPQLHMDTKEEEFQPLQKPLLYGGRDDFAYDEGKRQAECAIVQDYAHIPSVMARFPYILGTDDFTGRLQFYVDHIIKEQPLYVDNIDEPMAFVNSTQAGRFLAFLAERSFRGAVNGASSGGTSIRQIASYVEAVTGKALVLSPQGDPAPYNGTRAYSLNTQKAAGLGFAFAPLSHWIFDLLDACIFQATGGRLGHESSE